MRANSETSAKAFTGLFERDDVDQAAREEYIAEQDEHILVSNLQFAERLFPKNGLSSCPVSHSRTPYFSKTCEQILGHPHSTLMSLTLSDFFSLIHPDDLPALQQCFRHMSALKPFDPEVYRFVTHFRFKNRYNEFVLIRNEHIALKITPKSYLYLMLYARGDEGEKFYHVKLDIFKKMKDAYVKTGTYNPTQQEKAMTPRQNDITRLVVQGYTNQEIADALGVSLYTVKNHKKALFKKINVRNSIELANYASRS